MFEPSSMPQYGGSNFPWPILIKALFTVGFSIMLASCVNTTAFRCDASSHCIFVSDFYILSRDQSKRNDAVKEVIEASRRFKVMFNHRLSSGVLSLDLSIDTSIYASWQSRWRLDYDIDQANQLNRNVTTRIASMLSVRDRDNWKEYGISDNIINSTLIRRHGIISHELCHKFILEFMGDKALSSAMGEVAAVSCETPDLIASRLKRFYDHLLENQQFSWDQFLVMDHPLDSSSELANAIEVERKQKSNVTVFAVDLNSLTGRTVDVYYSQAAAFGAYWTSTCRNEKVLADLYSKISPKYNFSQRLRSRKGSCGPRSVGEFDEEIKQFIISKIPIDQIRSIP